MRKEEFAKKFREVVEEVKGPPGEQGVIIEIKLPKSSEEEKKEKVEKVEKEEKEEKEGKEEKD